MVIKYRLYSVNMKVAVLHLSRRLRSKTRALEFENFCSGAICSLLAEDLT